MHIEALASAEVLHGLICAYGVLCRRYYTPEVHTAAFALPKFARDAMAGKWW